MKLCAGSFGLKLVIWQLWTEFIESTPIPRLQFTAKVVVG